MKKALSLSLAFVLGLFINSVASAQDKENIPKKALKELDFMAGRWQSEMYENGQEIGTAVGERKWSPEKYCLLFSASFVLHGEEFEASGISGWTRKGRAIVEHWYASNGASLTVRYPLNKMKDDAWEGTHHLVHADGSERKGPCKLQKGNDQWTYTVEWEENGEKKNSKSVSRKLKE